MRRLLAAFLASLVPILTASPGLARQHAPDRPSATAAAAARAPQAQPPSDGSAIASPFAAGTSTLELAGVLWLESWNKNSATDRLLGGHVTMARTWAAGWQAVLEFEMLRADLARSRDAFQIGAAGLLRRRLWRFSRHEIFIEAGIGLAGATAPIPNDGTTFNYLLQGGGGVVRPLTSRWGVVGGLRIWHLSNGGTIRGDRRNPDIEALGGYVGLQVQVERRPIR